MSFKSLPLLYMRNLRQIPRIPTVLVFGIMMPVIQLVLFGSIFSATTDLPGHPYAGIEYYAFIAPAIVLLTTFLGMANASAAFLVDLRTGYFDKLRTTPASPATFIAARLGADMTRVALQACLILLIALLLGARVETGPLGALVMVLCSVVFSTLTVGLLVMALAMKTKSDQATQSAFPLFFVFIFLSTAYMPEQLLPGWLQTAVKFNPIDYLIQGLRGLMLEGWGDAAVDLAIALGGAVVVAVLLSLLNLRIYRNMTA
ncbi:MAG: ABC transporter permease [Thermoplasmatota archaeon]